MPRSNKPRPARHILVWGITQLFWLRGCVSIDFFIEKSDQRMKYLSGILSGRGYPVKGFDSSADGPVCLIVSPGKTPDMLVGLIERLSPGSVLIGGQRSGLVYDSAKEHSIRYINIAADEAFAVKNAVPTAEGALMLILENSDRTVMGMHVAITGFGRIGRILAKMLHSLGASVHVIARNPIDRAWAMGYESCGLEDMKEVFFRCAAVVNTVPAPIIGRDELDALERGSLIIELASHPYGFDADMAKELGHRAIVAPGLPAKTAPCSAAEFMADAIERLI